MRWFLFCIAVLLWLPNRLPVLRDLTWDDTAKAEHVSEVDEHSMGTLVNIPISNKSIKVNMGEPTPNALNLDLASA
jgi:hypothetical protein